MVVPVYPVVEEYEGENLILVVVVTLHGILICPSMSRRNRSPILPINL